MLFWFGLGVLAAAAIYGWLAYRHSSKSLPEVESASMPPMQVGDRFRIATTDELITHLDLAPALANIKANLGLSDENWRNDALPLLHALIDFVQRLPASEFHHHAGDGGLIRHTLDVAALALIASAAHSFPPGAKTEEIARLTAVWRYGVLVAALLHDVGKTLTGVTVQLFADELSTGYTRWMPDAGSMRESGRTFYRVDFPDNKEAYTTHAELGWTFFQVLVPAHVRQWMAASDPNLVLTLRQYLSGIKTDSILHDLVKHADMTSVARDLQSGSRQRFAAARRIPLIETVMETLIEMLAERGAHFSIATTAGGDLFRAGEVAYLVAKIVPDSIRDHLKTSGSHAAPSFPADNQRIFDTLLEYGAVIPNPHDPGRAITIIEVVFTRADGTVSKHQFTVLAFKLATLYPSGGYPHEFQGSLTVIHEKDKVVTPRTQPSVTPIVGPVPDNVVAGDTVNPPVFEEESVPTEMPRSHAPGADADLGIDMLLMQSGLIESDENLAETQAESPHNPVAEAVNTSFVGKAVPLAQKTKPSQSQSIDRLKNLFAPTTEVKTSVALTDSGLPASESAAAGMAEARQMRHSASTSSPRPVTVMQTSGNVSDALNALDAVEESSPEALDHRSITQAALPRPDNSSDNSPLRHEGKRFWNWLANGLADGSISINQSASPVHFVPEGMLLVSPAVFRAYAGVFNRKDPQCPGLLAQRGFVALALHERTRRTALFYAVGGKNNKILFRCYLIPEKHLYHIIRAESRPPNNPDLTVTTDESLRQKNREASA